MPKLQAPIFTCFECGEVCTASDLSDSALAKATRIYGTKERGHALEVLQSRDLVCLLCEAEEEDGPASLYADDDAGQEFLGTKAWDPGRQVFFALNY